MMTICILGLTGGVGGAIGDALLRHGYSVRAPVRDPAAASHRWSQREGVTILPGDAMDADDVLRAADGCSAIVHAVNPPGYQRWGELVLPMIDNTIAAARATGARIVLPGTIYNFDPARTPVLGEYSPQKPRSEKGRIRREMERRLEEAAGDSCRALILRAGDFFGPGARASWFSQSLVAPGRPVRRLVNPGKGVGHSWAYLPDLAETFARLIAMDDRLRPFERVQLEGTWDADGSLLPTTIRQVVGRPVPEYAFPWWLMRALAPFGGFPAAVREVEAYWRHPVRLDNSHLVELLGQEPRTPLGDAIRATLSAAGNLDDAPQPALALA